MEENQIHRRGDLNSRDRIEILLEEYRALNALLLFRLSALDRRLPISSAFLAIVAASLSGLPEGIRLCVLAATPLLVVWQVRTTIQQAQAKEDHIRRIDEIERAVNALAGEDLLLFQSQHPNRRQVSGRSGQATITATTSGGLLTLLLCVVLFRGPSPLTVWIYLLYIVCAAVDLVMFRVRLSTYQYGQPLSADRGH